MDSSELYHIKQQFTLGAYKSLASHPLPDSSSPEFTQTLLYKCRAYIALSQPSSALSLLSPSLISSSIALKAVASLAKFVLAHQQGDGGEEALEELRDLIVEIEGEDGEDEGEGWEKGAVKVLAGTAFVRAGEVEEALETLSAEHDNLEAVALTSQIYLSIHRPDLSQKLFNIVRNHSDNDTLLQLIESSISLVTGKDTYSDPLNFYTEQLSNPSLSSPHLLVARGVSRLLAGEVPAAKSDLEESVSQSGGQADEETLAALVVASGLGTGKDKSSSEEVEQLWSQLQAKYPAHPLVNDILEKSALFDEVAARFDVPPLATAAA